MLEKIFKIASIIVKKLFNINMGTIKRRVHKRVGQILCHKKYTARDIVAVMQEMGMREGSLVCIHCAMAEFYNYRENDKKLIDEILKVIGPNGTLMMPAFPIIPKGNEENYIFDPMHDKTGAGYLAETFRNYPGVRRSCNVRASVCAIGPLSEYLLNEHHKGIDCWDEKSPWYKLCINNGLVFNFGLPKSYMGTFYHSVESVLKNEHPYWSQFFTKKRIYFYKLEDKVYRYENIDCDLYRRTRKKKIMRLFTKEDWMIRRISNLRIKVFYTGHLFPKLVNLGRHGITAYYIPSPQKYKW